MFMKFFCTYHAVSLVVKNEDIAGYIEIFTGKIARERGERMK